MPGGGCYRVLPGKWRWPAGILYLVEGLRLVGDELLWAAVISLFVAWYNFCREHETLKQTPAMASGLADGVWSLADLLGAASR